MTEPIPASGENKSGSRRSDLIWFSMLLFPVSAAAVFFFFYPKWGERANTASGLLVNALGIAITILVARNVRPFVRGSRLDATVPSGAFLSRRSRLVLISLVFAIAMSSIVTFYLVQREPDPDELMRGHVRIGYVANDQAGFSQPDPASDTQAGFESVVANALLEEFPEMDRPEWVPLDSYPQRIDALRGRWGDDQEPVDLVISTFSITEPRKRKIDFAGPYFRDYQALAAINPKVKDLPDLSFNKVCTPDGTTGQRRLKTYGWNPKAAESLQKCFALLQQSQVDAVSTDQVILSSYLTKHPGTGAKIRRPFFGSNEEYGIGIPNNSPKLCRRINAAISKFLEAGWNDAYVAHAVALGLTKEDLPSHKPREVDPCERPSAWYER